MGLQKLTEERKDTENVLGGTYEKKHNFTRNRMKLYNQIIKFDLNERNEKHFVLFEF